MDEMRGAHDKKDPLFWRFDWSPEPEETQPMGSLPKQFEAPKECRLVPKAILTLPWQKSERSFLKNEDDDPDGIDAYHDFAANICEYAHQVMGYFPAWQDDPRSQIARAVTGAKTDRGLEGEIGKWVPLWRIGTDVVPALTLGNDGDIMIMIRKEDLEAGHLDKAWLTHQNR
jgi:hypothetical protein